jgi:hypothetical protein
VAFRGRVQAVAASPVDMNRIVVFWSQIPAPSWLLWPLAARVFMLLQQLLIWFAFGDPLDFVALRMCTSVRVVGEMNEPR